MDRWLLAVSQVCGRRPGMPVGKCAGAPGLACGWLVRRGAGVSSAAWLRDRRFAGVQSGTVPGVTEQESVWAQVAHAAAPAGVPELAVPGLGQPAARPGRRPGRAGDLGP